MRVLALRYGKVSLGQGLTTKDEKRERCVLALGKKEELHVLSLRVVCWNGKMQAVVLSERD